VNRVRVVKVLLVVVPVLVFVVVLRGLGEGCRQSGLPGGYGLIEETPRWRVYGPEGDPDMALVGPAIDRFVDRFVADWGDAFRLVSPSDRISVYVFRTREDFARWTPRRLSDGIDRVAGFWQPDAWTIAAVTHTGPGLETLRHEAVHMLLDRAVRGQGHAWSVWLNEGLAQTFEEGLVEDGRLVPGRVPRGLATGLRRTHEAGELVPTWKLIAQDHAGFHEVRSEALNYAHAWALTTWLLTTRRQEFVEYFESEREPGPVPPGEFTSRFGEDVREPMLAWLEENAVD
jgi:hypothetical protein